MKTRKNRSSGVELTVLKQGTPSTHVLSVSFFTMKDAYRNVGKYETYLQKFLRQKNQLKGFETRIYTDDSAKEIILKVVKEDPTVTVIHYNVPPFREEVGHIGTFGTIMRFLPLFEPGLETVWVSDIDIPDSYLSPSLLSSMKARNAKFSYMSFVCYDKKVYGRAYTILAGTMISLYTFPKQLFTKFLTLLQRPTKAFQHMLDELNGAARGKPSSKIPYGTDEIFTNTSLYNYLIKESIPCLIRKDYEYARTALYGIRTKKDDEVFEAYYRHPTQKIFEQLKRIFKEKLPLITTKSSCIQDMIHRMDSFKTSFIKTFVKTGKELDTIEA
jgi:hypothetical protein